MRCVVCDGVMERAFTARERMHGLPGEWTVLRCPACGLLRLADPPEDLGAYYPSTYYAHGGAAEDDTPRARRRRRLWEDLYRARYDPAFPAGPKRFLLRRWKERQVRGLALGEGKRLLDVGCGDGRFLDLARGLGLDVHGVEPSPAGAARARGRGLDVRTGTLLDAKWPGAHFDVVAFNHSFEHVPDPVETLAEAARVTKEGGLVVVAVPNADSWAARRFREDWVQLDAPRHLFGWSPSTLERLGARVGLRVERVRRISTPFGVLGSLDYRAGRGLDPRGGWLGRSWAWTLATPFVRALDAAGKGDTVEVWFRKRGGGTSATTTS